MIRELVVALIVTVFSACARHSDRQASTDGSGSKKAVLLAPDISGWPVVNGQHRQVGVITTRLKNDQIIVSLRTQGLSPGVHPVSIGQTPKCEAPNFASALTSSSRRDEKRKVGDLRVRTDRSGELTFILATKVWSTELVGGRSLIVVGAPRHDPNEMTHDSKGPIACGVFFLRRD